VIQAKEPEQKVALISLGKGSVFFILSQVLDGITI
jgi:hypothetical protein